MPRAWSLALLALVAAQALAMAQQPAADAPDEHANPTRIVTMFPHVFGVGTGAPMPGNTQFPSGEDDFSRGTFVPCHDAVATPIAIPAVGTVSNCDDLGINVLYVYSTAGFVHTDLDTFDYANIHNERGQAKDILLDPTQDVTATFFMSADAHAWVPSTVIGEELLPGVPSGVPVWNWDPGVHPDWQVEATLFIGSMGEYQGQASEPPPAHEKVASGDVVVVAQGVSTPQTMVSLDENVNGHGEVYEFNVNLGKPQVDRIPKEMDWILRYRWWSFTNDQRYILPLSWNVNSGEFYPNRFTLPVKNPFDVELVYPQFLHDKLLIHAMLNSPWGSYDVDSKSVAIDVRGDTAGPVQMQTFTRSADFSVAHGGHYKPVNITWVWDFQADKLAPGDYTVTVTASNFQHSASSTTQGKFRILPDGTGHVLVIGRSGQQTSTEGQLVPLGGAPSG